MLFSYDYLKITNEKNDTFGVYCGQRSGDKVFVLGDYAEISFHSDESYQGRGFLIYFSNVSLGKNGTTTTAQQGSPKKSQGVLVK